MVNDNYSGRHVADLRQSLGIRLPLLPAPPNAGPGQFVRPPVSIRQDMNEIPVLLLEGLDINRLVFAVVVLDIRLVYRSAVPTAPS